MDNLVFYEKSNQGGSLSVLGVPLDLGKDASGTELAPAYIRNAGLKKMCEEIGFSYKDLGDIECGDKIVTPIGDIKVKYLDEIARVCEESAKIVKSEIQNGNKTLVLGGDHSISIGNISGASAACDGDLGVVWIDAHGDMMTHENTLSGNIHGMPSSAIMGFGHKKLTGILSPGAKIKTENIIYIGLKDLDQEEVDLIRSKSLKAFTVMDIARHGLDPVMSSIAELRKRVGRVWVSLDVDAIDSLYSPATPMATSGGLSGREISCLTKYIGKMDGLVGMDIVEVAPDMDENGKTGKLLMELIANLLGSEYSWYSQYMKKEAGKQEEREKGKK